MTGSFHLLPPVRELSSIWTAVLEVIKRCPAPFQAQALSLLILPIYPNSEHFYIDIYVSSPVSPPPQAAQPTKPHVKSTISAALRDQKIKFKVALGSVCLSPVEGHIWHTNSWGPTIVRAEG